MPKNTTVDTRGLSCPQPALQASQLLQQLALGTVEVLVDAGTAQDNVIRVAERAGWHVTEEAQVDGSVMLVLRK
jgi:TusA-related sulfurtransferase